MGNVCMGGAKLEETHAHKRKHTQKMLHGQEARFEVSTFLKYAIAILYDSYIMQS